MREFPTPQVVGLHRFVTGLVANDENVKPKEWEPPTDLEGEQIRVIGWAPTGVAYEPEANRTVLKLELYIPPQLRNIDNDAVDDPKFMDIVTLPGQGRCDVQGVRDYNHGFHGWRPGKVVDLEMVMG